jgi:hypothetical protein
MVARGSKNANSRTSKNVNSRARNSKGSKNSRVPNSPRTKTRKINRANRHMLFRYMHNENLNAANRYANALHRYSVKDLEKMTNAEINGLDEIDKDIKDKIKLWKREKKTIPGVLKYLGISPGHAKILADANITYRDLKIIGRADLIAIGFKVGPAIKIIKWQKTVDDLSAAVHAPSFFVKQFATGSGISAGTSPGSLGSPPTAPVLKRNNTISYELYQELTDKGDETRKIEMDRAMQPLTSIHLDGLLRLETEGAHVFRIGDDKDVYFNWINTAGKRHFHVSLHNSKAPKFSNRLSAERQEVGSLHVKQDINVGGGGAPLVRRILINYNLTTRQYEVSIDNENPESTESIDELARQVVRAFREYYAPRNHRNR